MYLTDWFLRNVEKCEMKLNKQEGMTLIELTVVLLILVALAGLAIPYVSGTSRKALCDATDVSMANIKKVIMDRYYLDTLGQFPSDNTNANHSLNFLFNAGSRSAFDLDSQVGWRGPYLQGAITLISGEGYSAGSLSSFAAFSSPFNAATDHIHKDFTDGESIVLDSWGRPFIIQVDSVTDGSCTNWGSLTTDSLCARLVSAGSDSGLGLEGASIDTVITGHRVGNDRILYLNAPTPALDVNPPCGG